MATNRNFTNFRAVYDDLTDEVARSREQFLSDHLENWFALIDETPGVRDYVKSLESLVFMSFLGWFGDVKRVDPSPLADRSRSRTNLSWPQGPDNRLGMQLSVFREISKRRISAREFGERFIKTESVGTTFSQDVITHIFMPMARELRRRLEGHFSDNEELMVPASDRAVSLDHNSEPYRDIMEALDDLQKLLEQANDYPDSEDREQRIAEVSATRTLLKATRVRLGAIIQVAKPALTFLSKKFADVAIGKIAGVALGKLGALIGALWSSF
jgi:hypothetical protein